MEKRTCFECDHHIVCVVFKSIVGFPTNMKFNIDTNDAPGRWIDIFDAVGNACLEFKSNKVK